MDRPSAPLGARANIRRFVNFLQVLGRSYWAGSTFAIMQHQNRIPAGRASARGPRGLKPYMPVGPVLFLQHAPSDSRYIHFMIDEEHDKTIDHDCDEVNGLRLDRPRFEQVPKRSHNKRHVAQSLVFQ